MGFEVGFEARPASKSASRSGWASKSASRSGWASKSASRSDWASKSASRPVFFIFVFGLIFGVGDKMGKFIETDFELETQMTTVHVPQTEETFLIENQSEPKKPCSLAYKTALLVRILAYLWIAFSLVFYGLSNRVAPYIGVLVLIIADILFIVLHHSNRA